jgi:hypothetical protein
MTVAVLAVAAVMMAVTYAVTWLMTWQVLVLSKKNAHSDSSYSEELASLNAAAAPWKPPAATETPAMTAADARSNSAAVAYSLSDARSDLADDMVNDVAASVPGAWDSTEVLQMYVDAQQQLQRIRAAQRHQRSRPSFDSRSVRSVLSKLKSEISQQYARSTLLHDAEMRALRYLQQELLQCWKQFAACSDTHLMCQWGSLVARNAELARTILQQVCMKHLKRYYILLALASRYQQLHSKS